MKFTEVLKQLNVEYKTEGNHHCRPGWIQIDCPFCGKNSHKWHLGYSLEDNYLNCWRCGSHQLIETLIEITGDTYDKCRKLLGDIESVSVKKEKPKGKLILPMSNGRLQPIHKQYLKSRGFNPNKLKKIWGICGIGIAAKLSWRIFIPIFYHGKMVSWTTRSIAHNNKITRYISASLKEESMQHKTLLYGEDYAKETIIITEGPLDVWKIGPGAISVLGLGYNQAQVNRMVKYKKRIICFDNDSYAQGRAKNLCNDLSVFPGETFNVQLDAKDAAATSDKEIKQLRKEFL